jgi:hypothetical protein
LEVALTLGEGTALGSGGHVEGAAHEIVTILAIVRGGDVVEAGLEAELAAADKAGKHDCQGTV